MSSILYNKKYTLKNWFSLHNKRLQTPPKSKVKRGVQIPSYITNFWYKMKPEAVKLNENLISFG